MGLNTRGNVAYDYNALPLEKEKQTPRVVPVRKKKSKFRLTAKGVMCFVLCLVTVCAILVNYAHVTELNAYKASLENQLKSAQDEEKKLNVIIDERTSLRNVEEYARDVLGMTDRQPYQIEYLSPSGKDSIEVVSQNGGISKLVYIVNKGFKSVLSYFN